MRILIAVPVKRGQLFEQSYSSILGLRWPERHQLDYLFMVGGDSSALRYENITHKYNQAREVALMGGYDAMVSIESDAIAPQDALERLVAVRADVVYCLYVLRGLWCWSATTVVKETGELKFLSDNPQLARQSWGKVIDTVGLGQHCTLYRRTFLEQARFWSPRPDVWSSDWGVSLDCQRLGLVQKCDMGLACGHILGDPPQVYWPDPNEERLIRVEPLIEP